jgi:tetratricopeptide (TPR) repeat protein
MVVATAGIFKREACAYWLLLLASVAEAGFLAYIVADSGSLGFLCCMTPFLGLSLFILYTIYMAGEDFQKRPVRQIAVVSDRLKDPADLDRVAQKLAKEGKWASAVLYWQRAVGRASGHAPYLLRLGRAYGQLGFYERSLDTLKSALEAARNAETRQEIEKELVHVTRLSRAAETKDKGEAGSSNW